MISKARPDHRSRVFGDLGVFIHIPRFNGEGQELFIGEKPFVPHQSVTVVDPIINFFVYYFDNSGAIHFQHNFDGAPLLLQVRYDLIRDDRELLIYDSPTGPVSYYTIAGGNLEKVRGNFHGFPGSCILELPEIPPDPNVGWGG